MKKLVLLVLIAISFNAHAQFEVYDSAPFWHRLSLDNSINPAAISTNDTAMVVISNRIMQKDSMRFMSQKRDERMLHYFFVYTKGGKWHIYETKDIEEAISYMPDKNKDWLTYVEGMGKLFTSDLERGITVTGMYGVNVIMFDYPSISAAYGKGLGNYFFSVRNSKTAYKDFTVAFADIKSLRDHHKMGTGHISMLFHSMGNNVIREIVRHEKLFVINDEVWVNNIILNAPCVPQAGHRRWIDKIKFAERIYVHYNPKDYTLGGAYLVSKRNQLGMKINRQTSKHVEYINFHTLVAKEHSYFLSLPRRSPAKPEAIRHYRIVLHGNAADLDNMNAYIPGQYKHIGWDVVPEKQTALTKGN